MLSGAASCASLVDLSLASCVRDAGTATRVSESLLCLTSLTTLDLSWNPAFSGEAMRLLCRGLARSPTLTVLQLQGVLVSHWLG